MNQRELQIRPVVIRFELLEHYQELGLNENDLVILIKILYAYESSNEQPSIDVLKKGTTMQSSEVTAIIQKLIQLGLLAMRVEKIMKVNSLNILILMAFTNNWLLFLNKSKHLKKRRLKKKHLKWCLKKSKLHLGGHYHH